MKRRLALDDLPVVDVACDGVDDVCRLERCGPVVGLEHHANPVECVVTGEKVVVVGDQYAALALGLGNDLAVVAAGAEFGHRDDALDIVTECPTVLGKTRLGHLVEQQRKAHLQVFGACNSPARA